jgi:hypothetical protein
MAVWLVVVLLTLLVGLFPNTLTVVQRIVFTLSEVTARLK